MPRKSRTSTFHTYVRSEEAGHVRGCHAGQAAEAVDKRHDGGRVVRRQVERVDTHAGVTEAHERQADGEAHDCQHLVASDERGDHNTQTRSDGSYGKRTHKHNQRKQ